MDCPDLEISEGCCLVHNLLVAQLLDVRGSKSQHLREDICRVFANRQRSPLEASRSQGRLRHDSVDADGHAGLLIQHGRGYLPCLPMCPTYTRAHLVLDLSRHLCITAGADAVAYIERDRGLQALQADRLLAPGTDDQEIGKGLTRARALHGFTLPRNLVFHSHSP